MSVTVDVSELRRFASDLGRAPAKVQRGVTPVVMKGATKIKAGMQADMRESPSFRPIASSISYDVNADSGGVEAEIGPRKGSPGSLANIAYFGGSNGGGGTVDILGPLAEEADPFERALLDLAEDAI